MSRLSASLALDNPKKALLRTIDELAHGRRRWEVFRDFVEVSAISFSNAVDIVQRPAREQRYLDIIKNYSKEEAQKLCFCLTALTEALEAGFGDPLGSVFMDLDLGSHWAGQYFTPYPVASMMARMNVVDIPPEQEFFTVHEPAAGSGVMVIALAEALHSAHINYQQRMHVHAVDIDITAVHMAYVQFSLLHIPAIVIHGNALSCEEWAHWRTPAHCLGFWDSKLARRSREATPQASTAVVDTTATPAQFPPADIQMPSQLSLL